MEGDGRLIGVDLDEDDERFGTGGEGTVPDDIAGQKLHDSCFEREEGLLAANCGYGMSKYGAM